MSKTSEVSATKHCGWVVKHNQTGKALLHIKAEGKNVEYLGYNWCSLSAFAWVPAKSNGVTQFNKKACQNMAKLYTVQTGDKDVAVVKVDIF